MLQISWDSRDHEATDSNERHGASYSTGGYAGVETASCYQSRVGIRFADSDVDGKSILRVLSLGYGRRQPASGPPPRSWRPCRRARAPAKS